MSLQEISFTSALLFAAVVVAVIGGAAVYIAIHNRRIRRETGREVRTAHPSVATARDEPAESPTQRAAAPPRREFYKSMGRTKKCVGSRTVRAGRSRAVFHLGDLEVKEEG
jgi:hypothetical protein